VKLIEQPNDGIAPLVNAIESARRSIDILIFRFDQREIEHALAAAVTRGVAVRALIAHANSSGQAGLRQLEMRLLSAGASVVRTADEFVRYHAKFMIVDGQELWLLAFNLTHNDVDRSRSFGVVTRERELVEETARLFEADCKRQHYTAGVPTLVVSPANARQRLARFIKAAKTELLIYDPKISDPQMVHLLDERAKAGVEIRVIGEAARRTGLTVRKLGPMRLHTRTMLRDRECAFLGSQSLREMELDRRREVGIIFGDKAIIERMLATFESDWENSADSAAAAQPRRTPPVAKVAKKVAKALARDLPPVTPVLEETLRELAVEPNGLPLEPEEVEEVVRDAVKEAVKEAVRDVVEEARRASGT